MHLPVGTLLQRGKYKIIRYIGSGGFGCTYEALNTNFRNKPKTVAIKEFFVKDFCNRDALSNNVAIGTLSKRGLVKRLREKFVEEAEALYELQHSNIVHVTDLFEENDTAYYVMDYIDGQSLDAFISKHGRLDEKLALGYICQIASALKFVHAHNRLHLDVKPQNIMIDKNGKAILIDFGVSKQYDEVNGENTSTLLGHTPGYAPIEQSGNSVADFSPSTDIYSLGATLYKALTGETPVPANLRASGKKLLQLPANVTPCTRVAVEKSMQLILEKRPQNIDAFLSLLNGDLNIHEDSRSSFLRIRNNLFWFLAFTLLTFIVASVIYLVSKSLGEDYDVAVEETQIVDNGYEYVDLGLPSGTKWAKRNIDAMSPEDPGGYFAWGEVDTKGNFNEDTYAYYFEDEYDSEDGYVDIGNDISGLVCDVARNKWGGSWHMPTKEDFEELRVNCEWKYEETKGFGGYRITGINGNSIFLPLTGARDEMQLDDEDYGYYWSATMTDENSEEAWCLMFDDSEIDIEEEDCCIGSVIRPVI